MDELARVRDVAKPANVLLVLDSMTGQEAVNVALAFQELIAGLGKQLEGLDDIDEKQFARVEAIVLSMTPQERALPKLIDGSRRKRIAGGSGTTVEEVNRLLEGRKEMEKLMKGMSKGALPQLPGAPKPQQRKATKSNKRKKR